MKRHVLIAEEEERLRRWLVRCFQRCGFAVAAVASGRECLESVACRHPDLVLLDVLLRDMNGLELLQQLRERHPRVPTFVVTGHASTCAERISRELGAAGYCCDPWNGANLMHKVRDAMSLSWVGAPNSWVRKGREVCQRVLKSHPGKRFGCIPNTSRAVETAKGARPCRVASC
jgi:DNA-binding response OmpR family regulator